jgi:hypothetical protein
LPGECASLKLRQAGIELPAGPLPWGRPGPALPQSREEGRHVAGRGPAVPSRKRRKALPEVDFGVPELKDALVGVGVLVEAGSPGPTRALRTSTRPSQPPTRLPGAPVTGFAFGGEDLRTPRSIRARISGQPAYRNRAIPSSTSASKCRAS